MKKLSRLILVISLIFMLTGCYENIDSLNIDGDIQKEFKISEVAIVNNIYYTVINIQKHSNPATINGIGFVKPSDGNEYVLVTIKIENKSDEKISYYASSWKIQNSQGQESNAKYTKDFDSGELLKDGIKEGTIVFEQPKNDSDLRLNFYNNSLFDDNYTFQVSLQ